MVLELPKKFVALYYCKKNLKNWYSKNDSKYEYTLKKLNILLIEYTINSKLIESETKQRKGRTSVKKNLQYSTSLEKKSTLKQTITIY